MRHKYLLRLVLCLLLSMGGQMLVATAVLAQGPTWQTAVAIGQASGSNNRVSSSVIDGNGNVLLAGSFSGSVGFGATTLTSAGGTDAFVAKWNPATGTFSWAQRAGGTADDQAVSIAVQGSAIYVGGYFASANAGFGAVNLTNTSSNNSDGFVAKLTDVGSTASFGWAQGFGGIYSDAAFALAANGNNVYVTGQFNATARFGNMMLTTGSGGNVQANAFVAKLTDAGASGGFTWVRQVLGFSYNDARALVVDGPSVYIAGFFNGSVDFGISTLTSTQYFDGFVAKLTDVGATANFVWARSIGGSDEQNATALATDGRGALYVAGHYNGPTNFDNITLFTPSVTSRRHLFVAKLLDAGLTSRFVWAAGGGGSGDDGVGALAVSGNNLYLVGNISGMATFGTTVLNTPLRTDGLVAKLVDAGNTGSFTWAQQFGGIGFDFAGAVSTASNGTVYVSGSSELPASFGSLQLPGPANGSLGFLAAFTEGTGLASVAAAGTAGQEVTLFPNPAHGRAAVQVLAVPGVATATLTILDALGRTVRTQSAATNARVELDLTGLAPGLYAVRVKAGSCTATRRLVVE